MKIELSTEEVVAITSTIAAMISAESGDAYMRGQMSARLEASDKEIERLVEATRIDNGKRMSK